MTTTTEEQLTMIEDCQARESKLTTWEASFIASMDAILNEKGIITQRQVFKLEEIWERVTS